MVAFLFRMGAGVPGDVNRTEAGMTAEPANADPNNPIPAFGVPVAHNAAGDGGVRPLAATDTPGVVIGILLREFPTQGNPPNAYGAAQALGTGVPPTSGTITVLRRGYVAVQMNASAGVVKKGGTVYVWIAATTVGHTQGYYESAATPGSTIPLPATYMGPADANGVTEIAYNI